MVEKNLIRQRYNQNQNAEVAKISPLQSRRGTILNEQTNITINYRCDYNIDITKTKIFKQKHLVTNYFAFIPIVSLNINRSQYLRGSLVQSGLYLNTHRHLIVSVQLYNWIFTTSCVELNTFNNMYIGNVLPTFFTNIRNTASHGVLETWLKSYKIKIYVQVRYCMSVPPIIWCSGVGK